MAKTISRRRRDTLPYLAAACIAEKVLVEPDNVNSVIRIVDNTTVPADVMRNFKQGELTGFPFQLFLSIKAGDFRGKCTLTLFQINPSRQASENLSASVRRKK